MDMKTPHQSAEGFDLAEWAASNPKEYDRFAAYMEHVVPHLQRMVDACKEHRLPFAFIIGHTQHKDGRTAVACGSHFPSKEEALGEVIQAMLAGQGQLHPAMVVAQADSVRCMRVQAFFPESGSVH